MDFRDKYTTAQLKPLDSKGKEKVEISTESYLLAELLTDLTERIKLLKFKE
jgi:hypothetical protein